MVKGEKLCGIEMHRGEREVEEGQSKEREGGGRGDVRGGGLRARCGDGRWGGGCRLGRGCGSGGRVRVRRIS